jgi:hypothetical protein
LATVLLRSVHRATLVTQLRYRPPVWLYQVRVNSRVDAAQVRSADADAA